jgi:transposase
MNNDEISQAWSAYDRCKYTFLEMFFARWQWVRRRSKQFWCRHKDNGMWVKFTDKEMKLYEKLGITFKFADVEDWRNHE